MNGYFPRGRPDLFSLSNTILSINTIMDYILFIIFLSSISAFQNMEISTHTIS